MVERRCAIRIVIWSLKEDIFRIVLLISSFAAESGFADSASIWNGFRQINIIQFKIIRNRVSILLSTKIKSCRAVYIFCNIRYQIPFTPAGIIVHIIQFLFHKLMCTAFFPVKRIFPNFMLFISLPVLLLPRISLTVVIVQFLFAAPGV